MQGQPLAADKSRELPVAALLPMDPIRGVMYAGLDLTVPLRDGVGDVAFQVTTPRRHRKVFTSWLNTGPTHTPVYASPFSSRFRRKTRSRDGQSFSVGHFGPYHPAVSLAPVVQKEELTLQTFQLDLRADPVSFLDLPAGGNLLIAEGGPLWSKGFPRQAAGLA